MSEHFKIIYKDCGTGRSKVSLVKRKSDRKLMIWKRARSFRTRASIRESYRKEIIKSKKWRKFGISKVKVCWHPDNMSILKTYIKGPTLKKLLKDDPEFFSKTKRKPFKALIKFVRLLIDSENYIHDLKGANLVFDGTKWQVVDSGPIHKKSSRSATRREYRKFLYKKWAKSLHSKDAIESLKSFLEKYCR